MSLFYERAFHPQTSPAWIERCRAQIGDVLDALERSRAAAPGPFWFGAAIGHADIAAACALRFAGEAHPGLVELTPFPALAAHAARCEALPVFQEISQPFAPPNG